MIFLETERLCLRNVAVADTETIFDYRNNPVCARYQRGQTKDLEGIRSLVQKHRFDSFNTEEPFLVAVAQKGTDELIGEIVVMPSEETFSLGYTFSYRHHRQGYAYEALSGLLEMLHTAYPSWEFISFTDPENIPSRNLLRKLGYRDMGYLRSRDSQVYGKWTKPETDSEIAQIINRQEHMPKDTP